MSSSEKFCLKWNDFETNISLAFRELREEKDFFDVTLACEDDNQIQAHKVILSACSPFFRNILRRNSHQHPMLYLKGVKYRELLSVLNFMYMGEVSVAQEDLNTFLSVAEDLRVKGLTQNKQSVGEPKNVKLNQLPKPSSFSAPPKRPHNVSLEPEVVKRPKTTHSYQQEDNEVEEYTPVKTEPREHIPQEIPVQPVQTSFHTQDNYHTEVHEEACTDQGTVALDEGYAVDEGNDYQYTQEAYEDQSQANKIDTNKDLDSIINSKMSKNTNGEWQCNDCYKTSKVKTNIYYHVEANHVDSPGYQCDVCYKFCTTSNALRTHKYVKHKNEHYSYQ